MGNGNDYTVKRGFAGLESLASDFADGVGSPAQPKPFVSPPIQKDPVHDPRSGTTKPPPISKPSKPYDPTERSFSGSILVCALLLPIIVLYFLFSSQGSTKTAPSRSSTSAPMSAPIVAPTIVEKPKPPSTEEFLNICRTGSLWEVKRAIETGAPVYARDPRYGGTALMWAAGYNADPNVVSALIEAGARLNSRDNNNGTALLWAAGLNKNPEVVNVLIRAGADKTVRDDTGDTLETLMTARDIKEAQTLLNALGYNAGKVDGKPGSNTRAAVRAFEKSEKLSKSGEVSELLLSRLRAAKSDLESVEISAGQGKAWAQYNLALKYYYGRGVAINYSKAAVWYRKAAEQGHAGAQNNLGCMYDKGQGIPQNYSEAVKWYRNAAAQGEPYAQHNLGLMYQYGQGVPLNYEKAIEWYRKAAAQGDSDAKKKLDILLRK